MPPEYHRDNPKFLSKPETKVFVPTHHVTEDVETIEETDLCYSFIIASSKYVGRFYPTIPTDYIIGPVQYVLGHTIANIIQSSDIEGEWHVVGFQGKAQKESSNIDANNPSKLGVMSNAKLKPKKKRKNKKKKKKLTVKPEKETTVKKEVRTFKKVTNFIKSLSNTTKSWVS